MVIIIVTLHTFIIFKEHSLLLPVIVTYKGSIKANMAYRLHTNCIKAAYKMKPLYFMHYRSSLAE